MCQKMPRCRETLYLNNINRNKSDNGINGVKLRERVVLPRLPTVDLRIFVSIFPKDKYRKCLAKSLMAHICVRLSKMGSKPGLRFGKCFLS